MTTKIKVYHWLIARRSWRICSIFIGKMQFELCEVFFSKWNWENVRCASLGHYWQSKHGGGPFWSSQMTIVVKRLFFFWREHYSDVFRGEGWLSSSFSVKSDRRFFLSARTFKKILTQSDRNHVRELHWFQVAAGWRSILIWNRVCIFVSFASDVVLLQKRCDSYDSLNLSVSLWTVVRDDVSLVQYRLSDSFVS